MHLTRDNLVDRPVHVMQFNEIIMHLMRDNLVDRPVHVMQFNEIIMIT